MRPPAALLAVVLLSGCATTSTLRLAGAADTSKTASQWALEASILADAFTTVRGMERYDLVETNPLYPGAESATIAAITLTQLLLYRWAKRRWPDFHWKALEWSHAVVRFAVAGKNIDLMSRQE